MSVHENMLSDIPDIAKFVTTEVESVELPVNLEKILMSGFQIKVNNNLDYYNEMFTYLL